MTATDLTSARTGLVAAYRRLAGEGLLPLSAGNLSVRAGDMMVVTPTGADASVREEELVPMTMAGDVDGPGVPTSEWAMHAAIYAARPDIAAIVHTHSDACTALSCLRRPLPAFHYMVALFGGEDVPCTPYAHFGSPELGRLAAEALRERTACLLANHGMICCGPTLAAATKGALTLEMLARQYILACQAGDPVLLGPDEMAEAKRRFGYYGRSRIPNA
ncbi:class II aldolase/adducin family protein [Enterovirga aerilata]|uniref:Class II aldolase/adducin family protein n=1 Tax=Enterovirga aerilata TaxID=2730920 RepID=A0A849IFS5_9HYPH|nr:class II aldolase/adducin family protein [Enterovirga sp. DB1703]